MQLCETCGRPVEQPGRGPRKRFCDVTCRVAGHRGTPRADRATFYGPAAAVIVARRAEAGRLL